MSLEVVPYRAAHLHALRLQPWQAATRVTDVYAQALESAGGSYTATLAGHPVACAGIVEQWEGRGLCWALLSPDVGPHFIQLTRIVRRALNLAHYRRVEAIVDAEHAEGIRWAVALGFEVEARLRKCTPEGRDAFMYARVR